MEGHTRNGVALIELVQEAEMNISRLIRRIVKLKPDPNLGIARTACPFYGFTLGALGKGRGIMMDTAGNGCPLVGPLHHSPCWMVMNNLDPDWELCTKFNNERNQEAIEEYLDNITIAPKEHWPEGAQSWKGIPLRMWYDAITSRHKQT